MFKDLSLLKFKKFCYSRQLDCTKVNETSNERNYIKEHVVIKVQFNDTYNYTTSESCQCLNSIN